MDHKMFYNASIYSLKLIYRLKTISEVAKVHKLALYQSENKETANGLDEKFCPYKLRHCVRVRAQA